MGKTLDSWTVEGALSVTGASTLSSTLGVTGAATLSSTLGVTGAATLSSTLGVTGQLTVNTDVLLGASNSNYFSTYNWLAINADGLSISGLRVYDNGAGSWVTAVINSGSWSIA